MAQLIPDNPLEVVFLGAGSGRADFRIDNTTPGSAVPQNVELWERIISFTTATPLPPPPPNFTRVNSLGSSGTISSPIQVSRPSSPIPLGAVYQARLYAQGRGQSNGEGDVLAKLDFPCLSDSRVNVLTRCASVPQIDIKPGGTFVAMAFATAIRTMVRVQMGKTPPSVPLPSSGTSPLVPAAFTPADVLARTVSDSANFLHKVMLTDSLLPGDTAFFNILAWTAAGDWDFIWSTTGPAGSVLMQGITNPESITLKRRVVSVRLNKLHVLDDSDDLSDGEGSFTLVVSQAGAAQTQQFSSNFESGKSVSVPASMVVNIGPEAVTPANFGVFVRVDGTEDDSGFPFLDDDDLASTTVTLGISGQGLAFPVGEGKEEVNSELLLLPSKMLTAGDEFSFLAEIRVDINYVT
jgi:hypothetical protein